MVCLQENKPAGSQAEQPPSLVDRLIDSETEWRQLVREANERLGKPNPLLELSELQIKRQEVIHELVQTERNHCLTLALMRQVYLMGLRQLNEWRSLRDMPPVMSSHQYQLQLQHQHQHPQPAGSGPTKANSKQQMVLALQSQNQSQHLDPQLGAQGELIDLERLFPALDDLIQAHELLFAHLRLRLVESCRQERAMVGLVGPLGDLLCEQFRLRRSARESELAESGHPGAPSGGASVSAPAMVAAANGAKQQQQQQSNGHKLLQAYAKFCGQHSDSSRYYKQLMQSDKGFKLFIEVSYGSPEFTLSPGLFARPLHPAAPSGLTMEPLPHARPFCLEPNCRGAKGHSASLDLCRGHLWSRTQEALYVECTNWLGESRLSCSANELLLELWPICAPKSLILSSPTRACQIGSVLFLASRLAQVQGYKELAAAREQLAQLPVSDWSERLLLLAASSGQTVAAGRRQPITIACRQSACTSVVLRTMASLESRANQPNSAPTLSEPTLTGARASREIEKPSVNRRLEMRLRRLISSTIGQQSHSIRPGQH